MVFAVGRIDVGDPSIMVISAKSLRAFLMPRYGVCQAIERSNFRPLAKIIIAVRSSEFG